MYLSDTPHCARHLIYQSMRLGETHIDIYFVSLSQFDRKLLIKTTSDVLMRCQLQNIEPWSSRTAAVMILNKSDWFDEYRLNEKHFDFVTLTYDWKVTKMTWPKVTDIQSLTHIRCRHKRWVHHNLEVSSHSVIHYGLCWMQTCQNASGGEVTWCDMVTWS